MPMILITCPKTQKAVATGILMDKKSFDEPTNILQGNTVMCPHCGQPHVWDKEDARLADSAN
jgi:endogenous inhibitor of DNA gyrase (YacG/DUF329 family)